MRSSRSTFFASLEKLRTFAKACALRLPMPLRSTTKPSTAKFCDVAPPTGRNVANGCAAAKSAGGAKRPSLMMNNCGGSGLSAAPALASADASSSPVVAPPWRKQIRRASSSDVVRLVG
ncbi:MAG: hypothetical protein QM775_01790 [Pirellulales bacterium]